MPQKANPITKRDALHIALRVRSSREGERWTMTRFARENEVSTTMLNYVLDGSATSARLSDAINHCIHRYWPQQEPPRIDQLRAAA